MTSDRRTMYAKQKDHPGRPDQHRQAAQHLLGVAGADREAGLDDGRDHPSGRSRDSKRP